MIWDFAGEPVPPALADDVCRVSADAVDGLLGHRLADLLAPHELAAFGIRATDVIRDGRFPEPEPGYHAVPWPLV